MMNMRIRIALVGSLLLALCVGCSGREGSPLTPRSQVGPSGGIGQPPVITTLLVFEFTDPGWNTWDATNPEVINFGDERGLFLGATGDFPLTYAWHLEVVPLNSSHTPGLVGDVVTIWLGASPPPDVSTWPTFDPDVPGDYLFRIHVTDDDDETTERWLTVQFLESVQTVDIDIKPGSDPNSINCGNPDEIITIAVLTTPEFDATTVDHTTVLFEGAPEAHVSRKSYEARRHEEDVDDDGDMDLVLHFRNGETSLTCESTEGVLTGETYGGQSIEGTDAVRMVPPYILIEP